GFLLVCAPWFIASWKATGQILATRNAQNVEMTFYRNPRWESDPAAETETLSEVVRRDPGYFASRYGRNLAAHAMKNLTQLLGWPMALLPIAGLLSAGIRRPTRRQVALYLFATVYWLFMGIVFYQPRFFLPMILPSVAAGFALASGAGTSGSGAVFGQRLPALTAGLAAPAALGALAVALAIVQVPRIVSIERTIHARRPLYIFDAANALARR